MIYFRLPFGEKIMTTSGEGSAKVGFVSFDTKNKIDFKGDLKEIDFQYFNNLRLDSYQFSLEELKTKNFISKSNYIENIHQVINYIKSEGLKKLVIARKIGIDFKNLNLSKSFLNLCKAYPSAFVYIFQYQNTFWIGAFSEILGKFDKKNNVFETMSLAGTLSINEEWTEKEIKEQQAVTEYITDILNQFSNDLKISETYSHISGNIKHLRTDFTAKIQPKYLDFLIEKLHPTPAVCGIPKEECKRAIKEFEQFDREFYSGYSKIETADNLYFFVNLRCAKIYKNLAEIFVGGGITVQSNAEKEWIETELKSLAIKDNLVHNI